MKFLENTLMVLRDYRYLTTFVVLAGVLMFVFGLLIQTIFIYPQFVIHFSGVNIIDMIFFFTVPIFSSLTTTMLIYRIMKLKGSLRSEGGLGSVTAIISLFVGACTCSGFLLPLVTTLSSIGLSTTPTIVFITRYINEIRIATIALVIFSFYLTSKNLTIGCRIKS